MKQKINIETVRQLHREGKLDYAKEGYLNLLRSHPKDPEILHALGIVHSQQKHFDEALEYLKKAKDLQPRDPAIQLNLANVLKLQGLFNQALDVLKNVIVNHPEYAPAYNNLGTVFYALGQLDEAINAYQQAIEKFPNYIDAFYNLSLAYVKKNLTTEAIQTYEKLLAKSPDHFAARFHLACAFMQQDNLSAAINEFLHIEKNYPFHLETQINLANCYLKQGALNEAKNHYLKALEIEEDSQILFNLGAIHMQQGNIDQAIQYYQRTIRIKPDHFAAQNNLGVAFLAIGKKEYAKNHFAAALKIDPNNPSVAYTANVLAQNQPLLAAPSDYIQSLFDAYADHYDSHLLKALDYQIPAIFYKTLNKLLSNKKMDILDLGCGTGLCSEPFKSHANTLTGVDLSKEMLAAAKHKAIYDDLIQADFVTFLADKTEQYDLVLAGDAFVYCGTLDTIFQRIADSLRPRGFLIFNAEIADSHEYKMNQSGRFSHSKQYLDQLALKNNLTIENYQTSITRLQNNEPVYGHVYVLRK